MIVPRDQRVLDQYFQEISRIPLLSPDEEVDLARRIHEGDEEALDALTRANLRFVVSVAKKYQGHGLSLTDLINEGNYGLMVAARRFDEKRGFKFISYAIWWIRQAILSAITGEGRLVRLPHNRASTITKMRRARSRLYQIHERQPTADEIAEEIGVSVDDVLLGMQYAAHHLSMDAPFAAEEEQTLLDVLPDEQSVSPDEALDGASVKIELEQVLNRLNPREAEVVRLYFGIDVEKALTLDEISKHIGVSAERVRQIKERALRRLRWQYVSHLPTPQ
ncbi:MAG TPA: RNA polymerase sigma factor RpoD/SigA [Rhodothermales bacterium]|nr:RNA polymerase sigma factor RpoD/SigA [Rhodothermales bacterium]